MPQPGLILSSDLQGSGLPGWFKGEILSDGSLWSVPALTSRVTSSRGLCRLPLLNGQSLLLPYHVPGVTERGPWVDPSEVFATGTDGWNTSAPPALYT